MHHSSDLENSTKAVEPKKLRRFLDWMRQVRSGEAINGGFFVVSRRSSSGRISMTVKPFEHPTRESADSEAQRLSQLPENHDKTFQVLEVSATARNGEFHARP